MPTETAPEHPFSQLARQANKMMDPFQKGFYVYSTETWTPNVNLYETGGNYLVCVDLAGVEKAKIDVEVVDQRLRLKGTRAMPQYDGGGDTTGDEAGQPQHRDEGQQARRVRIHLMEIDHGPFSREVELPADANREQIAATYQNGLLWIEIPKA